MLAKLLGRRALQRILLLLDIACAFAAVWLSLLFRKLELPSFEYWLQHVVYFLPLFVYAVCAMYLAELYVVTRPSETRTIVMRFAAVGIMGWLVGFVFFYFHLSAIHFPKTILLLFWLSFCALAIAVRRVMLWLLALRLTPVVFLGEGKSTAGLFDDLNANRLFGYKPAFLYHNAADKNALLEYLETSGGVQMYCAFTPSRNPFLKI